MRSRACSRRTTAQNSIAAEERLKEREREREREEQRKAAAAPVAAVHAQETGAQQQPARDFTPTKPERGREREFEVSLARRACMRASDDFSEDVEVAASERGPPTRACTSIVRGDGRFACM